MTSEKQRLIQGFIHSISDDIKLYQKLIALQQQQSTLYLNFDADALSNNVVQQTPILDQLKGNAVKRTQCMRKLDLPGDEKGVSKIFSILPEKLRFAVRKQWRQLETLIKQSQQYNQKNGQSSASFHELISQLTNSSPDTYEERLV